MALLFSAIPIQFCSGKYPCFFGIDATYYPIDNSTCFLYFAIISSNRNPKLIRRPVVKRIIYPVLFTVILALVGCASMPPVEIKPVTPDLKIAQSSIRPLKMGVVIPDPMSWSLFYKGEGSYSRDMTADMRAQGLMLERDLSRIVQDTLSQAFKQVVILRDLPQPGQYDAVVNLSIGQILTKERVVITGETCDITAAWTMTVLDGQNKEILNTKGISPSHNFAWSAFNPGPGWIKGINTTMSLILSELAGEWGAALYKLDISGSARR